MGRIVMPVLTLAAGCHAAEAADQSSLAAANFATASWPQAGRTPQHTNFSPDSPAPPYKVKWFAEFAPECIYSAQPVVADGRIVLTTLHGRVYALDTETGERLWVVKPGEAMWSGAAIGTPEYGGVGKTFVASWDGHVHALDSATGEEIWRYDTGEPISGAPCLAEDTIFIGTRDDTLLALTTGGREKWRTSLSWHIFTTVAYENGRVYAVTEDLHVHCADAETGNVIWTSEKLHGLIMREFYPVLHAGKVLLSVTPAVYSEAGGGLGVGPFVWNPPLEIMNKISVRIDGTDKLDSPTSFGARRSLIPERGMPPEMEQAQQELIALYERKPEYQTFYVLNQSDGRQAFTPMHHYGCGGLENLVMPPAVCANGELVMHAYLNAARLALYSLDRNRWTDVLFEIGWTNNDNLDVVSVGGNRVFVHGYFRGMLVLDLDTREVASAYIPRTPFQKQKPLKPSVLVAQDMPSSGNDPPFVEGLDGYGPTSMRADQ